MANYIEQKIWDRQKLIMLLQFLVTPVICIAMMIHKGWNYNNPSFLFSNAQNIMGIFICAILFVSCVKDRKNKNLRTACFAYLVSLTGWLMFISSVSMLMVITDDNHGFAMLVDTLLNLCSVILSLVFLTYLCELVEINKRQEKVLKRSIYALAIPEMILMLGNLPGRYFFEYNAQNAYVQKPAYLIFSLFPVVMNIVILIFVIRMPVGDTIKRTLVNFVTFPTLAVIVYILTGISFMYPALLCALIFIYGNVFTEYESSLVRKNLEIVQKENELLLAKNKQLRVEAELDMAAKIQNHVLPQSFPPFPQYDSFDLYASMKPAKEVGGDFYDFFLVDKDHLAMVIADVSGKGVPAALYMMTSKTMIKNAATEGATPAKILEIVNNQLCDYDQNVDMFVTVWIGIYEISTGKMIAANAGHEYPAICHNGGSFEMLKDQHGLVLGAFPGMKYKDYEICLGAGDTLFVYTDGVPEAINQKEEQFGNDRILDSLNHCAKEEMEALIHNVGQDLFSYIGEEEQFDDVTMLAIHKK